MKKILINLTLGCSLLSIANATENTNILKTKVSSSPSVVSAANMVKGGSLLTESGLDNVWKSREKLSDNDQALLADYYLNNKPKVPSDYAVAWKTARLIYFLGNYGVGENRFTVVNKDEGVKFFDYGVQAGKMAMGLDPSKVEGHYWYAVDLGSYGLAKGVIAAASSAGDGMDALRAAKKIDPSYQWYGSSRILGRYYQELPGIFGGSNKKALALYVEATQKSANSSVNWLYLGRYYLKDGDESQGLAMCEKGLSIPNADGKLEEARYRRELNECVNDAKSK